MSCVGAPGKKTLFENWLIKMKQEETSPDNLTSQAFVLIVTYICK